MDAREVWGPRARSAIGVLGKRLHVDLGELSSGVYFLRLQSDGEVQTQKLTVVR
ncbi:T9SS type A sorting domain-containing protein [Salinibacter sp. 10B]|uniref:T9SS type A sorting domain-containing protein n=1 Tax=Salinibacter sp. 10B TaxID=1923971 RepID=UPI0011B066A6|nr:T9SS type A sorting domain-containing protein [Salinibacter sp. 10B]